MGEGARIGGTNVINVNHKHKAFWQIAFPHMFYHRILDLWVEGYLRDPLELTFLRKD